MVFTIEGKVALITGGASGIGFHYARELLRNGLKVSYVKNKILQFFISQFFHYCFFLPSKAMRRKYECFSEKKYFTMRILSMLIKTTFLEVDLLYLIRSFLDFTISIFLS